MKRVEVCGGIASGKTTLATLLESAGFSTVYEHFHDVPFWEAFYEDPQNFAFETELAFLLQHYHQIKLARKTQDWLVCDFALLQDDAYSKLNLKDDQKKAFNAVYEQATKELGAPDLIVHLRCDEQEEFRRVRARGRPEEISIDISYLAGLNGAIATALATKKNGSRRIEVDSGRIDFSPHGAQQDTVVNMIRAQLGN